MKVTIKTSFERDVKKLRCKELKQKIECLILELKQVPDFSKVKDVKKLNGYKYSHRIAFKHNSVSYRVCVSYIGNGLIMERFLNRSKSYRLFLI